MRAAAQQPSQLRLAFEAHGWATLLRARCFLPKTLTNERLQPELVRSIKAVLSSGATAASVNALLASVIVLLVKKQAVQNSSIFKKLNFEISEIRVQLA